MSQIIYTIGFSKKSLRQFVRLLLDAKVTKLIDVRLNNTSQLSGYAKKDDIEYVMELIGISYVHAVSLAPDQELLDGYKKKKITWHDYERKYLGILNARNINQHTNEILGDGTPCFLCSEDKPDRCHRKLLVSFLKEHSKHNIDIKHLV